MSLRPVTYEAAKAEFKPLRRSGFKKHPDSLSQEENASGSRCLRQRKRLRRAGKKVKAWETERRRLKKRFQAKGITVCEFGFLVHDCAVDNFLSFAHSTKRSDPEFDIQEVAVACIPAHQILDEQMSHAEMKKAVLKAINRREVQP